jgi:hypothetical protein
MVERRAETTEVVPSKVTQGTRMIADAIAVIVIVGVLALIAMAPIDRR